MSYQQYFAEVEAVLSILDEWVSTHEPSEEVDEEAFTAAWQAAELLSRAYSVLVPFVGLELGKAALVLPDVQTAPSKIALYDAQGRQLNAE